MDPRVTERTEVTRSQRLASPTTAAVLGVLSLVFLLASLPLDLLVPGTASPSGSANAVTVVAWFVFGLSFTAVGVVVARRESRNPMGWLLLGAVLAIQVGSDAPAYAYLDYHKHHGALPLGQLAVLVSGAWIYGILMLPLIMLLFPDGRLGSRWRWPLRAYLAICVVFIAGTLGLAVADLSVRAPVDSSANLAGLTNGWFGPFYKAGFVSWLLVAVMAIVYQVRSYRRAGGERRQQLKWLGAGAMTCVVLLVLIIVWSGVSSNASWVVGDILFPLALTALPLAMGIGILRYRLYEIDRLISRTLSYAILTALLVGTFIGLVALTTNTLALSGRVGVAASTLAAAALFNPLRKRIQHLVDRRFNRARYDAEATVAAFSARLRDAVEIDVIRADLLDAVNRAVQPAHASVWIRQTPRV
jgi:hypothetical protein